MLAPVCQALYFTHLIFTMGVSFLEASPTWHLPPPSPPPACLHTLPGANTHTCGTSKSASSWVSTDVCFLALANPPKKIHIPLEQEQGAAVLDPGQDSPLRPGAAGRGAAGKAGRSYGPGQAGARAWAPLSVCCVAVCRLSSECGPLPICCCLNCVFPRPGLPKLSPAVTSCQPVVSPRLRSLPRDHPPPVRRSPRRALLTGSLGDRRRSRPEHPAVRARPR